MDELSPCPFCGGTNLFQSPRYDMGAIFRVGCLTCNAAVEHRVKDVSVDKWNYRAQRAAPGVRGGDVDAWLTRALELISEVESEYVGADRWGEYEAYNKLKVQMEAHLRSHPAQQTPPAAVEGV